MSRKQLFRQLNNQTVADIFERFVASQTAKGVSDKTIQNYYSHLHSLQKHLDFSAPLVTLTKEDLDNMVISMRQSGLAHNSISSYLRVFRTFLNWARKAGYTELEMANYKDKETVKETYTDAELMLLLQKPARNCDFCEYRNWVIINFLVNCGCRAGTIRNIQNRDVDFERKQVIFRHTFARKYLMGCGGDAFTLQHLLGQNRDVDFERKQVNFRHTKTGKIQTIPLCSMLVSILSDYAAMRGGDPSDYLFCSVYGTMLSENALKLAIADYNHKRGVLKTSIHMFRHTFARKYLMDCGGDAFTLQHLLGHSTLQMTKHYCAIFDSDIAGNYDLRSPLAQLCKPRERIRR